MRVGTEHAAGATLEAAHGNWLSQGLDEAMTPEGLSRRGKGETPPRAVQQVSLERVDGPSGGMSSYYGFRGYYLSLLLWLDDTGAAVIWDARGETAR